MAPRVVHALVSTVPDDGEPGIVSPNDWNDDHTITGLATSTTDNAIVRFDGTTGNQQNSVPTIDDNGGALFPTTQDAAGQWFEFRKSSSPTNFAGTRAQIIAQMVDTGSIAANGVIPGWEFVYTHSGDGHVTLSPNASTSVFAGLWVVGTKTGDGSGQAFTVTGQLGAVGAVGYNEFSPFAFELTNIGSTNGYMSGVEGYAADGTSGTNYATTFYWSAQRIAKFNASSHAAFMLLSPEGTQAINSIIEKNSTATGTLITGFSLSTFTFTSGVWATVPNNTNLNSLNSAGTGKMLLGVDASDVTNLGLTNTTSVLKLIKSDGTSSGFQVDASGVVTASKVNKVTITAPAAGSTLTIADGKTLTASNTLTLAGTDSKTLTLTTGLTVSGNDGTLSFGAASKTLTVNNTLALSGTDSSTLNIGGGGTLGTAAFDNTGTSGTTIPLLDGANTWSGIQTHSTAITLTGAEGNQIRFSLGGQVWRINTVSGGNFYVVDVTGGSKIPFIIATGATAVLTIGANYNFTSGRVSITDTTDANGASGGSITTAGGIDVSKSIISLSTVTATAFKTSTALVATGGGSTTAAFTASSVGGTGQPTTTNQNGWLKAQDSSGATIWIPVWK